MRTYTLSWLWIDVLSAAPILQLLYAFDGVDGAWAALLWLPLLKLLRLSRLRCVNVCMRLCMVSVYVRVDIDVYLLNFQHA